MAIDLEKLSAAPWRHNGFHTIISGDFRIAECDLDLSGVECEANADFIALARNAFEVMMRRGWTADKSSVEGEGWRVMMFGDHFAFTEDGEAGTFRSDRITAIPHWPDPFTALVEADAWYRANVEAKPHA